MAEYGNHPTIFSSYSDAELFAMYRGEKWSTMGEASRRELLQETVNRSAVANGEIGACRVVFADLEPGVNGEQSGDEIRLNRNRFVHDMDVFEYNGRRIATELEDSNMRALTTVLHEDLHAWQNQCIDGTIECPDPELLAEYMANNFNISVIETADGKFNLGQQYLLGTSANGGYYLYYFQSTERDAHRISEMKAAKIMEYLSQKYGNEPSFDAFREHLRINGFDATLQAAQERFGTKFVERDINTTLKNQFYNTKEPVSSPALAETVKKEMIASLQETNALKQAQPNLQSSTPSVSSEPSAINTDTSETIATEATAPSVGPATENSGISSESVGGIGGESSGGIGGGGTDSIDGGIN